MKEIHSDDIHDRNQESLRTLSRSIALSEGEFSLILARCNSVTLREKLMSQLREQCPVELREIILEAETENLEAIVRKEIAADPCSALGICCLESLHHLNEVLVTMNNARDEFRKNFPFPLVLWVTDDVLEKFIRFAPDFQSWGATQIEFENSTEDLLAFLGQVADEIFVPMLGVGAGRFIGNGSLNLQSGSQRRLEVDRAFAELQGRGAMLPPEVVACWELLQARDATHSLEASYPHYLRCWELWQQTDRLDRLGVLLFYLGLWWRRYAVFHRAENVLACERAKDYFSQALDRFREADRPDLVAKFINPLAEVLQRLQLWAPLQEVATEAIALQEQYQDPMRLARGYGFLAEVALGNGDWEKAEELARKALGILAPESRSPLTPLKKGGTGVNVPESRSPLTPLKKGGTGGATGVKVPLFKGDLGGSGVKVPLFKGDLGGSDRDGGSEPVSREEPESRSPLTPLKKGGTGGETGVKVPLSKGDLGGSGVKVPLFKGDLGGSDWEKSYHQGLYLFTIARAQRGLKRAQESLKTLDEAIATTQPQYDPELYIQLLEELRSLHLQEKQYRQAFDFKLKKNRIEHQFAFRAFIGAVRLTDRTDIRHPEEAIAEQDIVVDEIAASGRQQDVDRLIERMSRDDCKLTIIHGQSGVGKSSLVEAGFIPALEREMFQTRRLLPVLQRVYTRWEEELGRCLTEALENRGYSTVGESRSGIGAIFEQLRQNAFPKGHNLFTVLIFDQFEEFFFECKDSLQRRPFYEFLRDCLEIPYVKVILSLREDYLHYLLECNDRLVSLDSVNNNILDKKILYYLGNFSPGDAQSVIRCLTARSQLQLQPALLEEFVRDLAGILGEVRPIELQVVGAQLQTEEILEPEDYRQKGPKEKLVGRYLQETIQYCGEEHQSIAKLLLYLLTDENNTRPLKTRADLELELEIESDVLDFILEILVKSGLVLKVPAFPDDRYQLVHDYLVEFVRKQQPESAQLYAELERERKQRKLTEAKLIETQTRQLRAARRANVMLSGLVVGIFGVAVIATMGVINTYLTALSNETGDRSLDQLVLSLKAGRKFKQFSWAVLPETRLKLIAGLAKAVTNVGVEAINRLEGHSENINYIAFEPKSQLLASASDDNTVKIWGVNGELKMTLTGHEDGVNYVAFSPDGQLIATASKDTTIKLWNLQGDLLKTFTEHQGSVLSVAFSHDGQLLASSSKDQSVKIFKLETGHNIQTIDLQSNSITTIKFHPNSSNILVTAGKADFVKLWNLKKVSYQEINSYGTIDFRFNSDANKLILLNHHRIEVWEIQELSNQKDIIPDFPRKNTELNIFNLCHVGDERTTINGTSKYIELTLRYSPKILYLINPEYKKYIYNNKNNIIECSSTLLDNKAIILSKFTKRLSDLQKKIQIANKFSHNGNLLSAKTSPLLIFENDGSPVTPLKNIGYILKFSPNNQMVLTQSSETKTELQSLNGREVPLAGESSSFERIAVSPNGQVIATIDSDNSIKIWHRNGNLIATLDNPIQSINKIIFSPDSNILLIMGDDPDGVAKSWLWQFKTLNRLIELSSNLFKITGQFSPDSKILATIGNNYMNDNSVELWNVDDGQLIGNLPNHTEYINEIEFSPDSQIVATIGDDNLVKLYKTDNGHIIKVLTGHTEQVRKVAFSPDSQIIASVSQDQEIRLWQSNGEFIKTIDDFDIRVLVFFPGKAEFASVNSRKTVKFWDFTGKLVKTRQDNQEVIQDIRFSSKGQKIVGINFDKTLTIWHKETDELITTALEDRHRNKINNVIFSPNGETIISASDDKTVKLWNSNNGELLHTLEGHPDPVIKVSISDDGEIIRSISERSGIYDVQYKNRIRKIWTKDGELLKTIANSSSGNSLSSNLNGKILLDSQTQYRLKLWNLDGTLQQTFAGHQDSVNTATFSPDGTTIASGSNDGTIKLWRVSDGQLIKTIQEATKDHKAATHAVNSLRFSPDGNYLASGSNDKTVKIWDKDGTLLYTIDEHTAPVESVAFHPNSKYLASFSEDDTIRFWRTKDGKEIKTLIKEDSDDYDNDSLHFSHDGKYLVIKSKYGQEVKLHTLNMWNGIWSKEATLPIINDFSDTPPQPDGKNIGTSGDDEMLKINLDLDDLMERACDQIGDYLKYNPNVKESDRKLCDGIGDGE